MMGFCRTEFLSKLVCVSKLINVAFRKIIGTETHFKVNPKGMGVSPVDIDLAEHVEGDVVLPGGKLLDLGLRAGLLTTKLVAGESQDT